MIEFCVHRDFREDSEVMCCDVYLDDIAMPCQQKETCSRRLEIVFSSLMAFLVLPITVLITILVKSSWFGIQIQRLPSRKSTSDKQPPVSENLPSSSIIDAQNSNAPPPVPMNLDSSSHEILIAND